MDFAAGVYLSEASFPPMFPYHPNFTHCIRVNRTVYLHIHTGKGGGGRANQRED
jgi:hypothetical protein